MMKFIINRTYITRYFFKTKGTYIVKPYSHYANYLNGMSLKNAANDAGIETFHASAKRLLMTEHYLGDDFYPAIIDKETFDRVQTERIKRAAALGRLDRKPKRKAAKIPSLFSIGDITEHYDNPATQAEYIYSLLKSEVV